jgi:hypothetical protein
LRATFLRRAVQRHYKAEGFEAVFPRGGIHVGNCFVDGEVQTGAWKTAIELKSDKDDLLRGLGQLLEALSHGYDRALLATSQSRAERLDIHVFHASGIGLAAVNSKGEVAFVAEPKIVKLEV